VFTRVGFGVQGGSTQFADLKRRRTNRGQITIGVMEVTVGEKTAFETDKAAELGGPYSQAIIHNGLVYISGQVAVDSPHQSDRPGHYRGRNRGYLGEYTHPTGRSRILTGEGLTCHCVSGGRERLRSIQRGIQPLFSAGSTGKILHTGWENSFRDARRDQCCWLYLTGFHRYLVDKEWFS